MKTHELKIWPSQFQAVIDGRKSWEFRRNDRNFQVGDTLILREWDPSNSYPLRHTGRTHTVVVTHIVHGGQFEIPGGFCIMSIERKDGAL